MSEQDAMTLEAGLRLDIAIAKLVGWHIENDTLFDEYGRSVLSGDEWRQWRGVADHALWSRVPHYSTDLNAAFSLLNGLDWDITNNANSLREIYCLIETPPTRSGFADTLPLAICRAWLAWKVAQE